MTKGGAVDQTYKSDDLETAAHHLEHVDQSKTFRHIKTLDT
jgi:hypothetical protein